MIIFVTTNPGYWPRTSRKKKELEQGFGGVECLLIESRNHQLLRRKGDLLVKWSFFSHTKKKAISKFLPLI